VLSRSPCRFQETAVPRPLPAAANTASAAPPRRAGGPLLISLDGNIGAGKTTLLNAMREAWPGLYTVKEPVDDWLAMKDHEGKNILELFYADTARYAYTFQHVTLMTRIANTRAALEAHRDEPGAILVSERSILTDRHVFAEMLRAQGKLSPLEWQLYNMWYALLADVLDVAGVVFLDTPVGTCNERILHRARPGEAIPVEYLEDLDRAHRAWLADAAVPVLHVDTMATPREEVVARLRAFADSVQAARRPGVESAASAVKAAPAALHAPAVAGAGAADADPEGETPSALMRSPPAKLHPEAALEGARAAAEVEGPEVHASTPTKAAVAAACTAGAAVVTV